MKAKTAGLLNIIIAILLAILMLTKILEVKTSLLIYALIIALLGVSSKGYTIK